MNQRGYFAIGLCQPKVRENVGSVLRAASCYDAAFVAVTGRRFEQACTDTAKAWRHLPLLRTQDLLAIVPYSCKIVAIEICDKTESLPAFEHPERAFYIFGPEDGSIPPSLIEKAHHVVSIPTRYCMNLACTANVVLYDRMAKRARVPKTVEAA
ncbi:RNA methyltransferase [Hyphomicrobium sp. DY-1]|uniref:RNA methyltransferase n=1 Tax=Hyphomicrobium sp. DY-1 TaxID=3075650 RepID=UPI0039C19124